MFFEWDPDKAQGNRKKHGVSFETAATAFGDPLSVTIPDPDHSATEKRSILLGMAASGTLVVVVHTFREETIRLISARLATSQERKSYENA